VVVFVLVPSADGAPGVAGDPQDHDGDGEADERVGDVEAEAYHDGGGDDGEADV